MRSALEVVAYIVQSNPTIESVTCVTYAEGSNWPGLPAAGEGVNNDLLLKAIQQDRGERMLAQLSRNEGFEQHLRDVIQGLGANKLLGIVSKVRLVGGGSAHIPMMDFKCARSATNLELLGQLLGTFCRGRGWLLESGRSYHYYGCELLTEQEWIVFLGKSLLMSGYTDERYIGHQLVDGHCVLRLSSRKSKASVPMVVSALT